MVSDLKEFSILITGGGSGIGKGTALYLAKKGCKVTICGRTEKNLLETSTEIGTLCNYIVGDITNKKDRKEIISSAVHHGNGLDVLVNNAGNMYRTPLENLEEEVLIKIFNSNVISAMMLSSETVSYLKKSKGSIIFISSVHTKRAFSGASPYAATKGAIEILTKVLASELGPAGVRVNCVSPGAVPSLINKRAGILTEEQIEKRHKFLASEHRLGRIGTAKEVAEAIEYLICAQWTTGAILDVDGGLGLGALKD